MIDRQQEFVMNMYEENDVMGGIKGAGAGHRPSCGSDLWKSRMLHQ